MVTVAVVSSNTRELLLRCLGSLAPEVEAGRASVWVVDNASSDGSADAARREAPWAQVLEPGKNLGFGPAVNLVARQTDSEWLAAANADVALESGALETLVAVGGDPRVAAVAPRLVLPDGNTQHSVYRFPTLPFTVMFNLGALNLSRSLADRMLLETYWDPERPRRVDWAIGAFLLLRRSAFDAAGGFDDRQWLYAEDLDLCWRLADAGFTTRYEPSARILHESGAATMAAFGDQMTARWMAATYAVLVRRKGLAHAWATACVNLVGAAARVAWTAPLALISSRWREPRDLYRRWLAAHRQGLRSRAALLRQT